ncbi:hypothetical protein D3C79_37600 [compost metagenome]
MSSTVGYLIIGMWSRYQRQFNADDPRIAEMINDAGCGEAGVVELITDGAELVNDIVMEAVEWDLVPVEFNFDATHLDKTGRREDSLDAAVWDAIYNRSGVRVATENWLKKHMGTVLRED